MVLVICATWLMHKFSFPKFYLSLPFSPPGHPWPPFPSLYNIFLYLLCLRGLELTIMPRPEKLYIYEIEGRVEPPPELTGSDFLGCWREADYSYLFFGVPKE